MGVRVDLPPDLITRYRVPRYLGAFAVAWTVVALGNFVLTERLRWRPELVGLVSAATAICLIILRFWPHITWAYRFGGTFAIGSIGFRAASIAIGTMRIDTHDGALIAAISVGILTMFGRLYWDWWLLHVGPWHEEQKRLRREL